ncbi:hypothetical protein WJX73_009826 [Symbiochloris irregularis]|uniref:Uncharacterized protein n=1 Tax=Symbiochloris irregularis TaxID=706552 RepID=A0AAW1PUM4_9CHLO
MFVGKIVTQSAPFKITTPIRLTTAIMIRRESHSPLDQVLAVRRAGHPDIAICRMDYTFGTDTSRRHFEFDVRFGEKDLALGEIEIITHAGTKAFDVTDPDYQPLDRPSGLADGATWHVTGYTLPKVRKAKGPALAYAAEDSARKYVADPLK